SRRTLQFGHAVDVSDTEAELLHALDYLGRGRRAAGLDIDEVVEPAPLLGRRGGEQVEDGWCTARMRQRGCRDHRKDKCWVNFAQTDVGAAHCDHRPREAPAVAVEHRQGPKVDRLGGQRPGHDISYGFQERAAMVINYALRIAGGAGGVVERDRAAFVGWGRPREARI